MRMFTLDDEVVQSKARTASNKIGSVVWNLAEAEKTVLKAVEEVNKHSELSGIAYGSMLDKLEKTNDILEEYNQIESLVYDYCEEIDDNFFKEQEKILEGLSRLKVEDIRVPNNIGVVETRTIIEHGETYTYEVKKKDIGFEDLLTYGTVSEIMQNQYNQLKNIARENGEEFSGSINDYIKGLIEEGQFDYEVAWKKNTSLVIDLIPVVGDAKGIIECVVGKDLITGRELSNLERGLCLLSIIPFVGDGGKIAGRFLKEGIQSAGKLFAKEATVNVVSYMGSAAMQEVGINPLLALAIYQGGRVTYSKGKNFIDTLDMVGESKVSRLDYLRNKYGKLSIDEINNRINTRGLSSKHEILEQFNCKNNLKSIGFSDTQIKKALTTYDYNQINELFKRGYISEYNVKNVGGLNKLFKQDIDFNIPYWTDTKEIRDLIKKSNITDSEQIKNFREMFKWNIPVDEVLCNNNIYKNLDLSGFTDAERKSIDDILAFVVKRQDSIDTDLFFTRSNVDEILLKIKNGTYKIDTPDDVLNVKRSLTDEFKNRYSTNLTTVQRARLWQGDWGYYGIDSYSLDIFKKGEVVCCGYPYPTGYCFRVKEVLGKTSVEIFQGVQVKPFEGSYRDQLIKFEILEDIENAQGITAANPHLGKGGIVQNYVPDFEQALREGKIVPLLDTDTINNLEGKKVWIRSLGKELEVTFDPVKLLEKDASGNYKYATICSVGDSIKADGNAIVLDNKYIVNDISTLTMDEFTKYGIEGLELDKINKEIGKELNNICEAIGKIRGGMQ